LPSPRARVGRSAEILAAAELGRRGYKIVASNYRCRRGEIDLIAHDADCLVFIEVRCKRTGEYGTPAESITPSKIRKLFATAQQYLLDNDFGDVACRFDVVEVVAEGGKLVVREVIRDAFTF
jgi:putative endonuclease